MSRSETGKFVKDVIIRFLTKFILRLRSLFFLPLISKNLGAAQYGIWTQMAITLGLLIPAFMLRLETATVRYLSSGESEERTQTFFSMLFLIWSVLIPIITLSFLFREKIQDFLFGSTEAPIIYINLFLILILVRTSFRFVRNYYRASSQINKFSMIQIFSSFTSLGLSSYFVLSGSDISRVILAFVIVETVSTSFIVIDIVRMNGIPKMISFPDLVPFLKYSLPLVPNAVLLWVINYSDRFVITHLMGVGKVGIYSASYSVGKIVTFFLAPISVVLFPKISRMWENNRPEKVRLYIKESLTYFLMLAIPSALGIYYLAPYILEVLATPSFVTRRLLVLFLTLGFLTLGAYQIYFYIIHLFERTKYLPLIFFFVASLNLGLNLLLVPRIGLLGAALATWVSYFFQAAIIIVWAKRLFTVKVNLSKIWKMSLSAFFMFGMLHLFNPNNIVTILLVILFGAVLYLFSLIITKAVGKREWGLLRKVFR